jgi:LPXTG-motif cell wall-anchored protein
MKPNDFNGLELNNGQTIYYKNEKSFSFVINKQWLSSEGNPLEPPQSSVSVDVWRNIYTDEECTMKCSSELYKGGLTISADENWQLTLENLHASGQMNINGRNTDVYYTYYVKEDAVDGYDVSYSGNDGIVSGTVTITNTQLESYVLPDTGGIGKHGFMLAGMIIMFVAGTIIIKRKMTSYKGGLE